ncbi:MAG: O-methyltransferase [candidate division Zixibacteria bacterium]|nr:O-methyltransferase [candidate division Zixibacteria bacterium]
MFHNIPQAIKERMAYLESLDKQDRLAGKSPLERLRQVPPETGKFLALLAASAPEGTYLEIGTSGGYSAMWLSLACKELGRKLITFEVLEEKANLARETFKITGLENVVELVFGDAKKYLQNCKNVAFCFLDAEKEEYLDCYEKVVPNLVSGGILVADNVISHKEVLEPMLERALKDVRVDALIVPIGRGELVCRKI